MIKRSLNIEDREFIGKALASYEAGWRKAKEEAEKKDHLEYQKKTKEQ
jgi:hypothetical protein